MTADENEMQLAARGEPLARARTRLCRAQGIRSSFSHGFVISLLSFGGAESRCTRPAASLATFGGSKKPSPRPPERRFIRDPEDVQRLVVARQEGALLADIFSSLSREPEVPGWSNHFKTVLGGPYFSGEGDDRPRDKQAELYLAATARQLGYAVALEEPDVVIVDGRKRFGVAAKRPRSRASLQTNVEKAVEQVGRAGRTGFVFLDLTLALEFHEQFAHVGNTMELEAARASVRTQVTDLTSSDQAESWIARRPESDRVFGVVGFALATAISRIDGRQLTIRQWSNRIRQMTPDSRGQRFYREFAERFGRLVLRGAAFDGRSRTSERAR